MPSNVQRDVASSFIDPILGCGGVISYGWEGNAYQEIRIQIADIDKIRYIFG